jgi:hypothetical protein
MLKTLSALIAFACLSACLSACSSMETNEVSGEKVAVEREYRTGSLIPQKKAARSTSDVKTVSGDDLRDAPRAMTPTDPLGKR